MMLTTTRRQKGHVPDYEIIVRYPYGHKALLTRLSPPQLF